MKKAIFLSSLAMAVMATNAMAQDNTTTVSLSATIADSISLGTVQYGASNDATITGSNNAFAATFPTSGNSVPQNLVTIIWTGSSVSTRHKLKVTSLNGGLSNPITLPSGSTAKTLVPYYVSYFWGYSSDSALLNLVTNPGQLSAERLEDPKTNLPLNLNILVAATTDLSSGTFSDTLTATITPNM